MNKLLATLTLIFSLGWAYTANVHFNQQQELAVLKAQKRYLEKEIILLEEKLAKPTYDWNGKASYYSEEGCIGCRSDRLMANGERFNEDALTVAFNRAPLNSWVHIKNPKTGLAVTAKVTDTGGFEDLDDPRIIDLSLGTKKALKCTDLCYVEIYR